MCQKSKLISFVKHNFIFILLVLTLIYLEINLYNRPFFEYRFENFNQHHYEVHQGSIYGFSELDGQLISEHNDPHITLQQIDDRVRHISIQCTNPNPDALSQVFYRQADQDWHEERSITFQLKAAETIVSLPETLNITSLRLDLTNQEGDVLTCQGFTLNPKPEFNLSNFRLALGVIGLMGLFIGKLLIPEKIAASIWNIFAPDGVWLFILMIVLINLAYPLTVTLDGAHYLWLADLIKTGQWARWDVLRNLGFPLHIYLSLQIFGYNRTALLYPAIFAHLILYFFSCQIVFDSLELKKGKARFLASLLIFLFIALDATVIGYFHVLLTEYLTAMIAVISTSVAIKLYQTPVFSKRFYWLSSIYLVLVPLAWHIKQPYIGAAFFPLLIVSLLILFRQYSWKNLVYVLSLNSIIALLVLLSTFAWNSFLKDQGNPMPEKRQLDTQLSEKFTDQANMAEDGFFDFLTDKVDEYLAFSNYYLFNFRTRSVIKQPQLGRGNENTMIAQRMFIKLDQSNLYFLSPKLEPYTTFLKTIYNPPLWLNNLFQSRMRLSHSLFTLSNLILPVFSLLTLWMWVKQKNILNTALLLMSAASLANLLAHLFIIIPNDRYQFWGYVLNLLILSIILIYLVKSTLKRLGKTESI